MSAPTKQAEAKLTASGYSEAIAAITETRRIGRDQSDPPCMIRMGKFYRRAIINATLSGLPAMLKEPVAQYCTADMLILEKGSIIPCPHQFNKPHGDPTIPDKISPCRKVILKSVAQ